MIAADSMISCGYLLINLINLENLQFPIPVIRFTQKEAINKTGIHLKDIIRDMKKNIKGDPSNYINTGELKSRLPKGYDFSCLQKYSLSCIEQSARLLSRVYRQPAAACM